MKYFHSLNRVSATAIGGALLGTLQSAVTLPVLAPSRGYPVYVRLRVNWTTHATVACDRT
jgi:hypothetical protein